MQFLVIAYDGTDADALDRRLSVREAHIALGDKMRDAGQSLYGGAILDDSGKMIGSVIICQFDAREQLDAWLKIEPYIMGNVWQKVEIQPFRIGPSFAKMKLA